MQVCNKCNILKLSDQYYPNRKSCKACVIKIVQAKHDFDHTPGVKNIKCLRCHLVRDAIFFKVSLETKLHKDICKICKGKSKFDEQRYNQLNDFFKQMLLNASLEDVQIIKDIITKI